MVRVTPAPVTVTVPVRSAVPVFAVAFSLNEPLPVRFEGLILETVSQLAALLLTLHVVSDVTLIVVLLCVGGGFHEVGDTVS